MKEHKDDALSSVKESTKTVDFATSDEMLTVRGKIEGIFGVKDREDMMVDVVNADHVMEDAAVVKEDDDNVLEIRAKTVEKIEAMVNENANGSVEVVKEVVQENVMISAANGSGCDDQKSGNGPVIGDSEMDFEPSSKEAKLRESVQEVDDGDHVMDENTQKETKVINFLKITKSTEGDGAVKNHSSSNEVFNAGTCEDSVNESSKNTENQFGVDQTKGNGFQSTIEATSDAFKKSESGTQAGDSKMVVELDRGVIEETMERTTEAVQEAANVDCVMSEKTGNDEISDSTKIPDSVTKVDEVITKQGLGGKDETQERVSEEEPDVRDKVNETELGFTNPVQQAVDGDQDSSKIPHSSLMVSLGLEEDDVVVDDEGFEGKKESQDHYSVEPNVGTYVVDQKAEVDSTNKDEISFAAIKPVEVTEPEPATDNMTPGIANEVFETDTRVQTFKVEPATIGQDSIDFQADQGLNIDEVLSWKDEIESVQEDNQKVDPTNLSYVQPKETEAASISLQQSRYFHDPENEGEFSVSDLVWGKVKSHPWWPGQIFNSSDASEKAMKKYKKDCFLVAYFGDHTFGWNENNSTVLKPFRKNFSQIVQTMDSKSDAFNNAVHCALEEVSRRIELGLTCSCISHEIYDNIKYQIVENSGIKQEASRRYGVDKSANVNSFQPDMLVNYVRLLAIFPYGDKMELTMAKAQLSSYGRFKGHRQLAEFQSCGDLLEVEHAIEEETFEYGSRKRKAFDSISNGSEKRLAFQKVASQLTGQFEQPGPTQPGNQLHLAGQDGQDPMKGYGFPNTIMPFFNTHRETVMSNSRFNSSNDDRKRKTSNKNESHEFEFDDVNDTYWTDRIIQNNPEEIPLQQQQHRNGGIHHQILAYEQEKQRVKPTRRSNKKRFFNINHEIEAKEQLELIERRQKNLATEILMKFTEGIYFPSEIHLNKMFKRFGPILESETEVDRQSGRARVVFKKCSDAEVAHNSAGKFNIFGSINVIYELNYTPLISYKPLPLPLGHDSAHAF